VCALRWPWRSDRIIDPADAWERPAPASAVAAGDRDRSGAYASRPADRWRVPAGAPDALAAACGTTGRGDLLLVEPDVRAADAARTKFVAAPTTVVGFGDQSAALWADGQVWVTVPYKHVMLVEDVHFLLYGRLTLYAPDARLTVRYNTVSRRAVIPLLASVRRRVAPPTGLTVPDRVPHDLPYKWEALLANPEIRLDPQAPMAVTAVTAERRRSHRVVGLVMATDREMAVLSEPLRAATGEYGTDARYLPRARLRHLDRVEDAVVIDSGESTLMVDIEGEVAAALVRFCEDLPSGLPGR